MCMVPPVLWPLRPDRAKHSATTPWPAKAASPCNRIGITEVRASSLRWSCLARTLPRTTGFTASRCDGFAVRLRWTVFPLNSRSEDAPRWYFTSPEPSTSSGLKLPPWNSLKIARYGLAITLANTDRRPRCGMPMTISSTPRLPPRLITCSMAGMRLSPPSRPKRLVPMYFTCRNFSKPSASTSLLRIALRPSRVKVISLSYPSMRSFSQLASSGLEMCMYCSAKVPQ
mmetsp:Transcript_28912/g.55173  ORF Transcript_28912/g.55173 Transcript_28912/m.55173 type:complete len:228 (+) Transcript_28912:1594-2277(+)